MMHYKKATEKVLNKIYSKEYVTEFSEDLTQNIKSWHDLNEHWNALFFDGLKEGGHGGYFQFLKEIVLETKPKHFVEIGNREGMSTLAIIDAIRKNDSGIFTTVDMINDLRFLSDEIKKYERIKFIFGDCLDPNIVQQIKDNGPIDILFLDTIHTYAQLRSEWLKYEPLMADEAIILIDDVNLNDKKLAFDKINHEKFIDTKLHVSGFGVVFYKKEHVTDEEFWENV